MLAPGSGLGAAYVGPDGMPLDGDTLAGMEAGHMPAPLHLLGGVRPYPCGCGRTWGCVEAYTTISGLPHLLEDMLKKYPQHELATSTAPTKEKVLSLRGRAQKGDALALEIFDFQAKAMGLHVANLTLALDTKYVVIGGGLMDPESTTPEFRERYLRIVRETAMPYLFPAQRATMKIVPATLGELSQAIGRRSWLSTPRRRKAAESRRAVSHRARGMRRGPNLRSLRSGAGLPRGAYWDCIETAPFLRCRSSWP
jgi:predicted NBD/HSP70 family sugar kinase